MPNSCRFSAKLLSFYIHPTDISDQGDVSATPGIGIHPPGLSALENRIRIKAKNGEEFIGRMEGYDAYSLTILTDSTEISIAYADMAWLQRSLGIHSRLIAGTIIGLGAGIFVGFRGASNVECNNESCVGEAIAATGILLLGSGGGTLLGMIVGAGTRREKWERVDIPGQSAVSITPIIGVHPNGRLALGTRISF